MPGNNSVAQLTTPANAVTDVGGSLKPNRARAKPAPRIVSDVAPILQQSRDVRGKKTHRLLWLQTVIGGLYNLAFHYGNSDAIPPPRQLPRHHY